MCMKIEHFLFRNFGEIMARLLSLLLFIGILIVPSFQSARHGDEPELLHVSKEKSAVNSPIRIPAEMLGEYVHGAAMRSKRDVKMTSSDAGTKDSTTPSNPSTIPLKKPTQITTNDRTNLTTQTTNNITTMVNKTEKLFLFA